MLKLSKIYSNDNDSFPEIKFRDGLNIVFANVTKESKSKSSHSLGKTTLVELINFTLLKTIDSKSFLKKNIFKEYVFFLELEYQEGCYVTIRRPVSGKISIHTSKNKDDLSHFDENDWEHSKVGLKKAKSIIDGLVSLSFTNNNPFTYRNGLRYCLRKQTEYESTFKVNTSRESDSNWKPYLAEVLGIESSLVKNKYDANAKVASIKSAIKEIDSLPQESTQSLEAEIAQIEAHISRMQAELDSFDFRKFDTDINNELIDNVSVDVANYNKNLYAIDQKIHSINESLNTEFSFDLERVVGLFEEVNLHFPDSLAHSYEELVNLNTQMSEGRKKRLKNTKIKLFEDRKVIEGLLDSATEQQKQLAGLLLQKDAFSKYKLFQSKLSKEESRLAVLNERVQKLDQASVLEDRLKGANIEKDVAEKALTQATRVRDNNTIKLAVEIFSEMVEEILSISAFFYTSTNNEGNLDFNIGLKDQTSVNDGFSYTRTLSAIFDLTLMKMHANESFYRFCYHDGLLESLDDRVKFRLINRMRDLSEQFGLQLIISVLDSDIPILENGEKDYFPDNEVIRELHDKGNLGRLFRMPSF
ncbi:DUF2326 domain-containing protein [Vibrio lentus]|uniref:DUF2326 domain-containing protein n=1 Tax=Vibrio TaxID=662 RepID=UPI000630953B|nr:MULTISPECIES: DUF2326 domain-containing protein [Vibrio]PMI42084.1 hypothetical protein BCU45_16275 [Vibrio lentus]PMJ57456.1 hypothetical protein BCU20_14845 [Vibrio lentus]CDU04306.1 conserved hypothetical protein [Vibrio coralliirubri]